MTEATTEKPTVVEAITAVKDEVGAVGKDGRNKQQGYNFRGVDAVVNAISRALITHGVVVAPVATSPHHGVIEAGQNRTPMSHCTVTVTYRFHGPAGDHIDVMVPGEAMDSGDKATPKAMSVAYRTALLQTLTLPTDEPDPDSHSYERSVPQQGQPQWEQPPPEPVTDQAWATKFEQRVGDATSEGVLKGLYEELRLKFDLYQLTKHDREVLGKLVALRKTELTASPEKDDPPKAAPNDSNDGGTGQ